MNNLARYAACGIVGLCLFLGSCATPPEPFTYTPDNELKPGPGLFSGEDGVFTIYGTSPAKAPDAGDDRQKESLGDQAPALSR